MCPCYKEEFLGNGDEYIKQSIHFKCKYPKKHFYNFVLEQNLFLKEITGIVVKTVLVILVFLMKFVGISFLSDTIWILDVINFVLML